MDTRVTAPAGVRDLARERTLFADVYTWMTVGLLLTAVTAFGTMSSFDLVRTVAKSFWLFAIAEIGLVWFISASIMRLSSVTATVLFLIYSALNGLTLSLVLLAYAKSTVQLAFFATAGTFAVTSVYGRVTKADLTKLGSLCIMALIGIIIASVVNIFWASSQLDWIITYAGLAIFIGLVAWDTQKIRQLSYSMEGDSETGRKIAILGALVLYLDFINIFLFVLKILGGSRSRD